MERTNNVLWRFCGDFSMITLAEKLLLFKREQVRPVVHGAVEFVSSKPMTITPNYTNSGVTLQYSLNGSTWTNIATGVATPSANVIYFRGQATGTKSLYTSSIGGNRWIFSGATNLECNGKLDRLLQNTLGSDDDVLTIGNYCFSYMLSNAGALISVDDDCLPATTLANSCYGNMFRGCINLKIAPALPATTLANSCYSNMFWGCTSLTTLPALPATTIAESCYAYMFRDCTALTIAPALPATALFPYCYSNMFWGCTSLTTLPKLPTLVLKGTCYSAMFYNCTKIKISTTMTGIYATAYRIPTSGTGTTATYALKDMFLATGGTFTGTPEINTTYYTENTPV